MIPMCKTYHFYSRLTMLKSKHIHLTKWENFYQETKLIIYTSNLTNFFKKCIQDKKISSLKEDLDIFDSIVNDPILINKPVLLLFNMVDVLYLQRNYHFLEGQEHLTFS